MEQKFLELFELKYKKIINSSEIMYKTLAKYNEMAFTLKKMVKETDLYIQSIVTLSLIQSSDISLELLKQLVDVFQYENTFKKLKLRKVKELDEELISKVKTIAVENLNLQPLFIKVASFFDKITAKLDKDNKVKGCVIIEECLLSMLLFVRNIDDNSENIKKYQRDIEIIYKYIER